MTIEKNKMCNKTMEDNDFGCTKIAPHPTSGKMIACKNARNSDGIAHASAMKTVTATAARSDLHNLIDSTLSDHEPIQITGKRGNAVLLSEPDWRALQETLYLLNIPGMRDSILEGMAVEIDECSESIDL